MTTLYGIWIDHASAQIVKTNPLGESFEIITVESGVDPHHKGGINSSEHFTISNQNKHNKKRSTEMHAFCKEVIGHLQNPDEIVIFGPSNGKFDLKHAIEENKAIASKLTKVETSDSFQRESELIAMTKKFLNLPRT